MYTYDSSTYAYICLHMYTYIHMYIHIIHIHAHTQRTHSQQSAPVMWQKKDHAEKLVTEERSKRETGSWRVQSSLSADIFLIFCVLQFCSRAIVCAFTGDASIDHVTHIFIVMARTHMSRVTCEFELPWSFSVPMPFAALLAGVLQVCCRCVAGVLQVCCRCVAGVLPCVARSL